MDAVWTPDADADHAFTPLVEVDHNALPGRSAADAHPISAISGLHAALAGAGGGLSGDSSADADTAAVAGLIDLTAEDPAGVWTIQNYTGSDALAIDFPDTGGQSFDATFVSLAVAGLTLTVDGVAVVVNPPVPVGLFASNDGVPMRFVSIVSAFGVWLAIPLVDLPATRVHTVPGSRTVLTGTSVSAVIDQADVALTGKADTAAVTAAVAALSEVAAAVAVETAARRATSTRPSLPSGALAATFNRKSVSASIAVAAPTALGTLYVVQIDDPLDAGTTITSASFRTGSTGVTSPTNWWFALLDASLNYLRVTADQTNTTWAANTVKTLNFSTPYVTTSSGQVLYLGLMVAASAPTPTMTGFTSSSSVALGIAPILSGASTTGLTAPPSLPAAAGALTVSSGVALGWVS